MANRDVSIVLRSQNVKHPGCSKAAGVRRNNSWVMLQVVFCQAA